MIIIKEVLFLYNIFNVDKIIDYNDNKMTFIYEEQKFVLKKNTFINQNLFVSGYPSFFHKVIKNKFYSYYTLYNNDYYVLYQLNDFRNSSISIDNIIDMSIPLYSFDVNKENYTNLWLKKNIYLENYLNDKFRFSDINYDYYLAMAEWALTISKKVNYNNLTYGYCVKKNNCFSCVEELYDPSNIKNGPIVCNITEYIKYDFFINDKVFDNFDFIVDLDLSADDYLFMICRFLYPNYYFDLFRYNDNDIKSKTFNIDSKINKYILFLKLVFVEIEKRHIIDMSLMKYIINLL